MAHIVLPSVNIFIVNGSKVLLGRRHNTGWMDGHLCPPGGHVEEGETPLVAAIRELQEEVGVAVEPGDLEFICAAARNTGDREYVAYEFLIRDKAYEFTNAEPHRCSELIWAELDNLPEETIDDFRQVILRSIIGSEKYLELGYDSVRP